MRSADLMWSATLALNGLTGAGVGRAGFPMHMIEHSLSALFDVAHGAGLSVVIPGWLRWRARTDTSRLEQLGSRVFGINGLPGCAAATETITRLEEWFARVNSPIRLAQVGIRVSDIPAIATNAVNLARVWRLEGYTPEVIEEILGLCV